MHKVNTHVFVLKNATKTALQLLKEYNVQACLSFLVAVEFSWRVPASLQSKSSLKLHIAYS